MNESNSTRIFRRPVVLFMFILGSIASVEFMVMSLLARMPELSVFGSTLFDVGTLSLTIAPILYLFLFKPLMRQAQTLKEANLKISQQQVAIEKAQELGHIGTWELDFITGNLSGTRETCRIIGAEGTPMCSLDSFLAVVHPEEKQGVVDAWEGVRRGRPFDIECRLQVGAQLKWVRQKAEVEYSEQGEPLKAIGFLQDITTVKNLQEKALRTAQLASVGELSSMVAHEVNNPLSGVMGYAQVLINRGEVGQSRELLERIIKEGERISLIVGRLLNFSYDSRGERSLQPLAPIITEVVGLMSRQLEKQEICLELDLPDELPQVECNPQQIEQVVLNILRNALQAVAERTSDPGKGMIRIQAGVGDAQEGDKVRLVLANNGPPIPKGMLERVKEPFYTTKPVGLGTGLGLSVSCDIMKAHGGTLEIESEPGDLTRFILSFPQAEEQAQL